MIFRKTRPRRQKFQHPINYKKYFRVAGLIFTICVILAGILFLFGLANKFLLQHDTSSVVLPISNIVDTDVIQKKLRERNIAFDSVAMATSGASIIITINSHTMAYLSSTKDIDWQVSSLQQILNQLTIENREPQYVDMRYDKPIVKF